MKKFHSKFYHSNYLENYRTIPSLTIEEAYILCWNDLRVMHRSGIYSGKRHDAAVNELKLLSELLIDHHLQQSGYDLAVSVQRCLEYVKVGS